MLLPKALGEEEGAEICHFPVRSRARSYGRPAAAGSKVASGASRGRARARGAGGGRRDFKWISPLASKAVRGSRRYALVPRRARIVGGLGLQMLSGAELDGQDVEVGGPEDSGTVLSGHIRSARSCARALLCPGVYPNPEHHV